jgi:hypothetical protein
LVSCWFAAARRERWAKRDALPSGMSHAESQPMGRSRVY